MKFLIFSLWKLNFSSISPRALTPNKSMWETCLRAQFVSLNTPAMKNFSPQNLQTRNNFKKFKNSFWGFHSETWHSVFWAVKLNSKVKGQCRLHQRPENEEAGESQWTIQILCKYKKTNQNLYLFSGMYFSLPKLWSNSIFYHVPEDKYCFGGYLIIFCVLFLKIFSSSLCKPHCSYVG